MLQIKEKLLSLYTRRLLKSNKIVRLNVGYKQAKVIGLLYTQEGAQKKATILKFIDELKNTGKKVRVLHYIPDVSLKHQFSDTSFPTFSKQDIGYLGKPMDRELADFVSTDFDYLYHLDLVSNPMLDYLLARSKAKCRVGIFDLNRYKLFEIMVKFEQKKDTNALHTLVDKMLYYTQLLET